MTLTKKNLNQNCHGPVITFFSCILKMCISYNRRDRLLIKMHIPLCLMIYIFYQKNIYYFFIFILLKNLSSEQTWCNQQANKLCLGSGSCRIRPQSDPPRLWPSESDPEWSNPEKGGLGHEKPKKSAKETWWYESEYENFVLINFPMKEWRISNII